LAYFTYLRSCIGPGIPHALTSGAIISEKEPDKKKIGRKVPVRDFRRGIAYSIFDRSGGRRPVIGLCRNSNA
jgi:hypothetical protein